MRLHRIKLAGFKSFVDPTSVHLPGNLTGVVGPNGCGKSNIIDAVRWVMGELSARYLRGYSMADVIFNGSSARKSVGSASVELVFDNNDGRIGGAYASYSEISLKRVVERDGSSGYFINGGRCRRRDITALFLGTGLGSRSYAIIEQGMISRVIEARADDMRAFIEEAAGISLYKERRRETESRIGDTRENLARLNDLREEVDKQIRHLQRQAGAARRYQEYQARERNLSAELLAFKLRELDAGADDHDRSVRDGELAMQQSLADQRAAEAGIDRQRELYAQLSGALSQVQGRHYEHGAQVTRTEESIRHSGELRERARRELDQAGQDQERVSAQMVRDEQQRSALREEIAELAPLVESRRVEEQRAAGALAAREADLSEWQQRWEEFNRELGTAGQSAQVEAARIEQLDSQRLRLQAQADRLDVEHDTLGVQAHEAGLGGLAEREAEGRAITETLAQQLADSLQQVQQLRAAQQAADARLERLRHEREQVRSELMSLEALQKAALREKNPRTGAWLAALPAASGRSRLAELLEVEPGWERAVETVLGDYLEAIGVDGLEQLEQALPQLPIGQLTFFEAGTQGETAAAVATTAIPTTGTLAAQVRAPASVAALLRTVHITGSLAEALRARAALADGDSLITAGGEWLGRGWLRVNRGGDVHAGVLEREHRLKGLRERCGVADARVAELEREIVAVRAQLGGAEGHRDRLQGRIQEAQREHAELRSQLEAHRARVEQALLRRARVEAERAEVARDIERTHATLGQARASHERATQSLAALEQRRAVLEPERGLRREHSTAARAQAQAAQLQLRDAMVRLEGRRSGESSMSAALERLQQQRESLQGRCRELEHAVAQAAEPLAQLERDLQQHLVRRQQVEGELAGARRTLEDAERELHALEQRRLTAEQRVTAARTAMEQARLAAQETRLRREALLEQFAATHCELATVLDALSPEAHIEAIEQRLAAVRADIERLGQVNLAAISELAEQTERKSYLDRQFADVSEALQTLEQAMRKIDRETRTRFEDTFNRVNAGLQQKFPRLFGGGHAYLELIGEDPLNAGVAVMARPPGKRNSTISQLSGGEKALTAVALVFAIFDLNPAPFCLLDEVDAPLDEHNVGRFCDIVREMSGQVQFIFITHNKQTMELASQLVGVTMSEPGVSRLVTVDLDEAVKLAAVP